MEHWQLELLALDFADAGFRLTWDAEVVTLSSRNPHDTSRIWYRTDPTLAEQLTYALGQCRALDALEREAARCGRAAEKGAR
jgi:hypothetical protein